MHVNGKAFFVCSSFNLLSLKSVCPQGGVINCYTSHEVRGHVLVKVEIPEDIPERSESKD